MFLQHRPGRLQTWKEIQCLRTMTYTYRTHSPDLGLSTCIGRREGPMSDGRGLKARGGSQRFKEDSYVTSHWAGHGVFSIDVRSLSRSVRS